mmetsp:Transcript_4837/g.13518  ORF Transcript_4837/g.13518 Transcript_4837/m.13518 type:complete len:236 (+) Transcript_4837:300-1007(+)
MSYLSFEFIRHMTKFVNSSFSMNPLELTSNLWNSLMTRSRYGESKSFVRAYSLTICCSFVSCLVCTANATVRDHSKNSSNPTTPWPSLPAARSTSKTAVLGNASSSSMSNLMRMILSNCSLVNVPQWSSSTSLNSANRSRTSKISRWYFLANLTRSASEYVTTSRGLSLAAASAKSPHGGQSAALAPLLTGEGMSKGWTPLLDKECIPALDHWPLLHVELPIPLLAPLTDWQPLP